MRRPDVIGDYPALRPPLVGQINCPYCKRRHSRRFACDDLIAAAIQHDVRTGLISAEDVCDCSCHQSVQPGLVPCPRCRRSKRGYDMRPVDEA